jgi:hypothetical protein
VARGFPEKGVSRGRKTANKRPASLRNSPAISGTSFLSRANLDLVSRMC